MNKTLRYNVIAMLLGAVAMAPKALASSATTVVYFGGFGSCSVAGDPGDLKVNDFLSDLGEEIAGAREGAVRVIRNCFAVGSSRVFSTQTFAGGEPSEISETNPERLIDSLASQLRQAGSQVVVVGQSHGGVMAARLVARLQAPEQVKLLITVDPISIRTCGPMTVTNGFLGGLFGGGGDPGCVGEPAEIGELGAAIANGSSFWLNIYQDDFAPLHSGAAQRADENLRFDGLDGGWHPMGAHAATETDSTILELIWNRALAVVE